MGFVEWAVRFRIADMIRLRNSGVTAPPSAMGSLDRFFV
jgi:hypothetical protein